MNLTVYVLNPPLLQIRSGSGDQGGLQNLFFFQTLFLLILSLILDCCLFCMMHRHFIFNVLEFNLSNSNPIFPHSINHERLRILPAHVCLSCVWKYDAVENNFCDSLNGLFVLIMWKWCAYITQIICHYIAFKIMLCMIS